MKPALHVQPLTPELHARMAAEAIKDGDHYVPLATHAFVRSDTEIVGGAAISIPTTIFWAHSAKLHARETFDLARRMRELSAPNFLTVCWSGSPLYPFMGKLGYHRLGNTDVFQS